MKQSARDQAESGIYSGAENLEVMEQAENYNAFLISMIRETCAPAGSNWLDFGAGSGYFASRVSTMASLLCVELDPHLRANLVRQGLSACADTAQVPADSIDAVYSLNVLEHISDDAAAAGELYRVLRPGGRLLIYVPAFELLYSAMDRKVGHLRRYQRQQLADLLMQAGFRLERIAYADSLGFLTALIYRWIGSRDGTINARALMVYDRAVFPLSRWLDGLLQHYFGKNLFAIASKPAP